MEIGISGEMLQLDSFKWIQSAANELGIAGVVFTKKDGSIRILAEGEETTLQVFADKVNKQEIFTRNAHLYANISDPENLGSFFIVTSDDV